MYSLWKLRQPEIIMLLNGRFTVGMRFLFQFVIGVNALAIQKVHVFMKYCTLKFYECLEICSNFRPTKSADVCDFRQRLGPCAGA